MCWFIEVDNDGAATGTCVPHCSGSGDAPICEDPNRECKINGEGVLALCLPNCNPLDPDACGKGEGCYPIGDRFECAPDVSGEAGGLFDPCTFANACDPGTFCADSEFVGLCDTGATGCCTPVCDLAEPTCPKGTSCVPYFEEGLTPPGYETLGYCGQEPQ